jgi:mannose-6-phosphate isomerase-like protein (cupin superfamily)
MKKLRSPSDEEMAKGIVRFRSLKGNPNSPLAAPGVEECPIITPKRTADGFEPGPIVGWWKHGFNLRCLKMQSGAKVPAHSRQEEEVIFVQSGTLEIATPKGTIVLGAGDTFSTPKAMSRAFRATSSDGCVAYVVRGGESIGAVEFVKKRKAA